MSKTNNIVPATRDKSSIESILTAVCRIWDIEPKTLLGRTRRQPVAFARQLAMALSYRMTNRSSVQIADSFGRNHATVLYAMKVVDEASNDPQVADYINQVIRASTETK